MANKPEILIAGAGPTGLTAALELARRGFKPRIIDRDEGPTPLSKAVGISARSLDILEESGVTRRLLEQGIRIRTAHMHFEGRHLGTIRFSDLPHRYNFMLALAQSETETTMADALRGLGIEVEWRTEFAGCTRSGNALTVTLVGPRGREEARFDYVFGADGVGSAVREALGAGFDGHTHERSWSIADAEIADWPYEADAFHGFLHRSGDIGVMVPIGRDRFRSVSNTHDALAHVPGSYTVSRVLRTDTFSIHVRQAERYQDSNVFLGGDAAHVHSPVGARGMNLGIEDAASFARRLAEGELDGYTEERKAIGGRWIALSERLLSAAQATGPVAVALRNTAISLIGHVPILQRQILERVAGLKE